MWGFPEGVTPWPWKASCFTVSSPVVCSIGTPSYDRISDSFKASFGIAFGIWTSKSLRLINFSFWNASCSKAKIMLWFVAEIESLLWNISTLYHRSIIHYFHMVCTSFIFQKTEVSWNRGLYPLNHQRSHHPFLDGFSNHAASLGYDYDHGNTHIWCVFTSDKILQASWNHTMIAVRMDKKYLPIGIPILDQKKNNTWLIWRVVESHIVIRQKRFWILL